MRFDELESRMRAGATLITPNQRAARVWRNRLAAVAGAAYVPTVLPWGAWTAAQWQDVLLEGRDDRSLLNAVQNAELWTQILREAQPATLRPLRSLVKLCLQAQHLIHQYGATERMLAYAGERNTDNALFADWFRRWTERCHEERLLPVSELENALARTGLQRNATLLLVGFDQLLPAQQDLLDMLPGTVERVDAAVAAGVVSAVPVLLRCADEAYEWCALAEELRRRLEQVEPGNDADGRRIGTIAVVLPNAEGCRAALERSLRSAFRNPVAGRDPWEFSAGRPLSAIAMVKDALEMLRWTQWPLPNEAVGRLLMSPYLDLHIGLERAGDLDTQVVRDARRLRPEWSIAALANRCGGREPALQQALFRVQSEAAQRLTGYGYAGDWAAAVLPVLQSAGWPGGRERDTVEYQVIDRWGDLLEGLATLDLFDRKMPFPEFLEHLEQGAADTLFAPENTGAPIQIMSAGEAAGSTTDLLWLAQADEGRWSGRRTPSPLLPWALQSDAGMPGTDSARDFAQHLLVTERLQRSAAASVFSYGAVSGNGDVRYAAVLDHLPGLRHEDARPAAISVNSVELEDWIDETAPALLEGGVVSGGVGVLKDQAACAFRAFAQRRLHSIEPETAELGFDPRERGNRLHRVLELFWAEVETQAELLRLRSTGGLDAVLQGHIDAVLAVPANSDGWNAAYLDLQRKRLRYVLGSWMELEAARPPFRVIATEATVKDVQVGPLRFDLRVDRIDEVESDGETVRVLVDYKTGSTSASGWMGERPDEPQLPIYAVSAGIEGVRAVAFAKVKAGEKNLGFSALPATTELLFAGKRDKDPAAFDVQMEAWYGTMRRLSEEFAAGDASVGPKQYPMTCTHCGQRMLCRLDADALEAVSEQDMVETAE